MGGEDLTGTVIAGFACTWREIRAPASRGEGANGGELAFGLWAPQDPDASLDAITQEEFERSDERMPYFCMIWPSAESLAAKVLAGPPLDGMHALDLGCGLGLSGLAAARRGAHITFFDWEPRALEIAAASAGQQGRPPSTFAFVAGDWREPPPLGPFDLILGADILYERRNGPAVAAFLAQHLRPGAEAWIADPGRAQAQPFLAFAQAEGLDLIGSETLPPQSHGETITLLRLCRPRQQY